MAKAQPQTKKKTAKKLAQAGIVLTLPEKENFFILLAGVVIIAIGYFLMSAGGVEDTLSLVIAPLVLVMGYCVVIPFGILYRRKQRDKTVEQPR